MENPNEFDFDTSYRLDDNEDTSRFHDADQDDQEIIAMLTQRDGRINFRQIEA